MFERFAKRWLGARKRTRGKGRGTKSRKAKSRRATTATGFLAALARRPALLLACGAGIGLIVGAVVATHRGSPPTVSVKPAEVPRSPAVMPAAKAPGRRRAHAGVASAEAQARR
jgi:hypothetical protein